MTDDEEHSDHSQFQIEVTGPEGNSTDDDSKSSEILVDFDVENIVVGGRDVQVLTQIFLNPYV